MTADMSWAEQTIEALVNFIASTPPCRADMQRRFLTRLGRLQAQMQLYTPVRACRLFAYDDAQRYRIGPNFGLLPVNRPRCPFFNNRQDGPMNFADQMGEINYYPSSFANQVLPHYMLVSGSCVSQLF